MRLTRFAATTVAALGLLAGSSVVAMQDATPAAGPPLPTGCSVVASGLNNPRYVATSADGTIYVSEAGTAGEEALSAPAEPGATPAAEAVIAHRGDTGQVTMIAPDGTQSVLITGLPSYDFGEGATGPAGIAVAPDGTIILAIGGPGHLTPVIEPVANENAVVAVDPATGAVSMLADIGAYERASNPEPTDIDSNLYGVDIGDDGTIYVNDAGGNVTYTVPSGGGEPAVLAVHPELPLPDGFEAPLDMTGLDPVPTGIEADDGAVFVGDLSGGPFPPGAAKVVSVAPDAAITDVATGLTMVVDVATGSDGALYVAQLSTDFLSQPPAPGNVVRVLADGTQEVVVDGLMLPNGIAFDQDGNLLVVTGAAAGPGNGALLRCESAAQPAASVEYEVVVSLQDVFFDPAELTIPANTDVTLKLVNEGRATHNLSIGGTSYVSPMLPGGDSVEMTVNLPPGRYVILCDVPGHRFAGMTGTLNVVAGT